MFPKLVLGVLAGAAGAAAPAAGFEIDGQAAPGILVVPPWTPAAYGLSSSASGVGCSLNISLIGTEGAGLGVTNPIDGNASPAGNVRAIHYDLLVPFVTSISTVYDIPSIAGLESCGFSNARNLVGAGPDASIIGSDVRDFAGDYFFRFDFDADDGTEHTCTIGWIGGWGTDLRNECLPVIASGGSSDDLTADDTERAISSFMLGRANQLAAHQPRLRRFLEAGDGLASRGCNTFSAAGTDMSGSMNGCGAVGNIWTEVSASWGNGTSYSLGTIGAHQFLSPNLLVGGMVQFDRATDKRNNVSGTGWLVGPYFAAKMAEQPLYFEGRLLYGQTRNKITPLGSYTDTFKTERWLAQLRAEGEIIQQNITWIPLFDVTHTRDRSKAYEDSLGNLIRSQSISLTQVTGGMDFRLPLQSDGGSLELLGGMSAIHSSTQGGIADFENTRGRIHMGVSYDSGVGTMIRAGTFYDGIGSGHRRIGGNLSADYRF